MLMFDGISGRPVSAGNTPGGRRCGMGWFISLHHDCDFCFGQAVTAKLEGGADIVLDVHGRVPGFEEKLSRAADAKTVIRRLGAVGGFVGVCVDYILVGFSVAHSVVAADGSDAAETNSVTGASNFAVPQCHWVAAYGGSHPAEGEFLERRGCGRSADIVSHYGRD